MLDGGTLGLSLVGRLDGRKAVVVLDAVRSGAPPGSCRVFTPQELWERRRAGEVSPHEGTALELLGAAALLGSLPPSVLVVGVEPFRVETGLGLSAEVQAGMAAAVALALSTIGRAVAGP